MNRRTLLARLTRGAVNNVDFSDMVNLVVGFGFRLVRTSGSHYIFEHPDVPNSVNLQSIRGEAKPYQVRQFLKTVDRHGLVLEDEE